MAARQTAWSSANRLASPKMRMAARQTAWRTQKCVWQLGKPLGKPQKCVWQNCPTSYGSREVASFAGIAEEYADESV